jgi:iron complex transport system substrate-binding protein
MRIISLEPYITELILAFGLEKDLAGVSDKCVLPKELAELPRVYLNDNQIGPEKLLLPEISPRALNLSAIKKAAPDTIIASVYKSPISEEVTREDILRLQANLSVNIGKEVKLISYAPRRLEEIFEGLKDLSRQLKVPHKGLDSAGKIKAQIMDWADNFYDRMKNKKVSFISSLNPFRLAGYWVPDMISMLSAHSQHANAGSGDKDIKWQDLLDYKPDVIVVAPRGYTLKESMGSFKTLENQIGWQDIPAVKRGEVVFADGTTTFYNPGNNIIDSTAILVSGLAGFESGYITPRDSFYRLRWLEMQRHKL